MGLAVESIDAQSVAKALSEVAEIASETLELQDVFDRVAAAIRELIPFDNMGVVRILDDDHAVVHASTVPCQGPVCSEPIPLTSGDCAAAGGPHSPAERPDVPARTPRRPRRPGKPAAQARESPPDKGKRRNRLRIRPSAWAVREG